MGALMRSPGGADWSNSEVPNESRGQWPLLVRWLGLQLMNVAIEAKCQIYSLKYSYQLFREVLVN